MPVVPDTRGFRKDTLAFLRELERTLKLSVQLALDDGGLAQEFRATREHVQAQADANPVSVPTQLNSLDTQWRKRLERELDAATAGIEATIPTTVDGERLRAELRRDVDAARAGLSAEIPTSPEEAADFRRKTDEMVKKISGRHAEINADADTAKAQAQLALAARNRRVQITAEISKKSLASVGTFLAAVSGARVAGDALSSIGSSLMSLDRAVPAIAGVALALGSLGSVAVSSVGGILTVGASLAPLAALAAPLPGLLLAAGAAAGVFAAAMVDAKAELASLGPQFGKLQDSISSSFWAQAKQPILDLVNGVFPALQSGLTDVASSLGKWSASVASSFQAAFPAEVITGITGQLSTAIQNSTRGTDAFAASIAALGTFGAQYLPAIGTAFSNLAIAFNGWIQTVVGNGQLAGWVQDAMSVLQQLGQVASNAFGIIGDVTSAAFAAGGTGLQGLVTALQAINDVTSGPAFQGALTTIFAGAAQGASNLSAALGPIGDLLVSLAPTIGAALSGLSASAGALIGGIASALSQPVVAQGLQDAIAGIMDGVDGLLPALPALATAFGSVASLVGTLAGVLGPVLGSALSVLSPLLTAAADAVQPLIDALGPVLTEAISSLAPAVASISAAFQPLIGAVLPVLMPLIQSLVPVVAMLGTYLADLATAVVPVVGALLSALAPALQAIAPLMTALIPVVTQIAQLVGQVLVVAFQAISPVITAVVAAVVPIVQSLATVISGVVSVVSGLLTGNWAQVWKGAQQIVSGVFGVISGVISGAISVIGSVVSAGLALVSRVFSSVWSAVSGGVSAAVSGIVGSVRNMASGIGSGVSEAVGFFASLPGKIAGALAGAGSWLVSVGRNIIEGLLNGLRSMGSAILSAVTAPIKDAISGAKSLLGIHSPSRVFRSIGEYTGQGLELGLRSSTGDVHSAFRDMLAYSVPSYTVNPNLASDVASSSAALSAGFPETMTLVDQDGSILARTRVIAGDAVAKGNNARGQQLTTGLNRRYA